MAKLAELFVEIKAPLNKLKQNLREYVDRFNLNLLIPENAP